jgi:putative ABC transport system ATP-binding protein
MAMHEISFDVPPLAGEGLSRWFGEGSTRVTAVHRLSVQMRRGEVLLIMGPSGSGKSTLLAMLSGLLQPSAGRVLALGHDLWNLSETQRQLFRLRHCGFIFQGYHLFGALTARQQLEVVLRWGLNAGGAEAVLRADAMLDLLGLGHRRHCRPDQLSGGEKQRVAIGRALIKGPAFCFADEPTSALDWHIGRHVIDLLRTAARADHTAVAVISHDPRILPFADRVLYLEDGREVRRTESPGASLHEVHPWN